MPDEPSSPSPLPAQKERQAAHVMAAFEYQVLHTIYAWISLREGEALMIEGAEDFDRLSEENAEAVQVKHSKANISLGQQKVIQSLNQFWNVISKDPRTVTCAYLSSSGVIAERDSPFGKDRSCLNLWSSGKLSDEEIETISSYLLEKDSLSDELKRFLSSESVEKRRAEFFERIRWRFDSGDAETVEQLIQDRLARFEGPYRIERASLLRRVLRALKDEVWRSLRESGNRLLDFARLAQVWEQEVSVHLSESELQALRSAASMSGGDRSHSIESSAVSEIPPLPSLCLQRDSLVSDSNILLRKHSILFLQGSSKMGKTTLSKCVAMGSNRKCLWWSGAGKSSEEVGLELKALSRELETMPDPLLLVLDNLDLSSNPYPKLEASLLTIRELLVHGRSQLLINSEYSPCPQAQQGLGLTGELLMAVPRLSPEEIESLLDYFKCPLDSSQVKAWATSIWAGSEGHPLLTVIRVCHLRDQNWPAFSTEQHLKKEKVISEIQDAHQLIEDLSEKQIELLLRLSLFPGFFRQDHAKELGDLVPEIKRPGSIFNRLVGPWIEPVTGSHFQLTPLLSDLARVDQSTKWCRSFRQQILQILLSTEPVTIDEAAEAFQIAWEDCIEDALTAFVIEVVKQDEHAYAQLGKQSFWFVAQGLAPGKLLYADNLTLSLLYRQVQFQFAENAWPRFVPLIVAAWKAELDRFSATHSQNDHLQMYLAKVLSYHEIIFTPEELVGLLQQLRLVGMPPEVKTPTCHLVEGRGMVDTLTLMALQRGREFQYLEQLITALNELDSEARTSILKNSMRDAFDANLMINRVWLHEGDKEAPDWRGLIAAFQRSLKMVAKWELPVMTGAFFRGMCLVLEEYLEDHDAIGVLLERAGQETQVPEEVILECQSSYLFGRGEFEKIGELCDKALGILPKSSISFDTQRAMLVRKAALAAGRLEQWSEAADWFQQIPENLLVPNEHNLAAGSHAERAFCFWKDGDHDACLSAMIDALKSSEALSSRAHEPVVFATRKLITHIVSWICGEANVTSGHDLTLPILGAATSGEAPDLILELPPPDESNTWPLLSRFEEIMGGGSKAFDQATKSAEANRNPGAQFLVTAESINRMLTTGEVSNLPKQVMLLAEVKNEALKGAPADIRPPHRDNPREFAADDAVPCLAAIVGLSRQISTLDLSSLLDNWRVSLEADLHDSWKEWFDSIERILALGFDEALREQKSETEWGKQMLFFWNFISASKTPKIFQVQSHFLWLREVAKQPFHEKVEEPFCTVAETTWKQLVANPGLLNSPMLHLPEVKRILSEEPSSYRKLAKLLKAGAPLLGLELDMNKLSFWLNDL